MWPFSFIQTYYFEFESEFDIELEIEFEVAFEFEFETEFKLEFEFEFKTNPCMEGIIQKNNFLKNKNHIFSFLKFWDINLSFTFHFFEIGILI